MKEYCSCREPDIMCAHCEREELHNNYMDERTCQIASVLIEKGRSQKRAYRVGARFAEREFRKLTQWD